MNSIHDVVYDTNCVHTLELGEEGSIHEVSLLKFKSSTSDGEERCLDTHTRNSSLVQSTNSLCLEDLHKHLRELDLQLGSLLSLHTSLDHIHRRHDTRSEATSHHSSHQQTSKRNVAMLILIVILDRSIQREEDHGVRNITQQRNRWTLVHTLHSKLLAHYTHTHQVSIPDHRPVRCSLGRVAWTCIRIFVISMGFVAITWQNPAPIDQTAHPPLLAPARIPLYQVTFPYSSAVCSRTKSFTANLMAFSGVTPMRFARIPLPRTHHTNNKPVETRRTFLSTNGLKAIPGTLILHRSCRLSLILTSCTKHNLKTSLHHIQRIHNRSTDNSSDTTDDKFLKKRDLQH